MSLLALTEIWKRFGATTALAGARFTLGAGEVHALVGANGAGKSTLSRVISGQLQPDSGSIVLDGKTMRFAGARDAIRAGIAMVTQETSLAPDLSVLENIMLPRLGMPGRLDWGAMRREARHLVTRLGAEAGIAIGARVRDLTIGQRQIVEILKALALDSRIIIFDEPTAPLSPHETERLFDMIRNLAATLHGIVFVSHRLEEIFALSDRVTVLREGRVAADAVPTRELTQGELIRLMVGRELSDIYARAERGTTAPVGTSLGTPLGTPLGAPVLRVSHLSAPPRVRDVSFTVHAGEILGLAGLVGAGRSETLETIFGLRPARGGTIELDGRPFTPATPREAIRKGIGLIPEDRRGQGTVPDFSVRENLLLAHLGAHRGPGLAYRLRDAAVRRLLALLGLPEQRLLDANLLTFSGGMQQKVILARWLVLSPRLLLLDEPTRGVDIATRSSIYALLRRIAAEGVASVVVSSDFEEVIGLADRIVVLSDGVDVTSIPSALVDIEKLGMFAAPRSSAERTHTVLEGLVARHGGRAFWISVEHGRVFCFDCVGTDAEADPGFAGGSFPEIAATRIQEALARKAPGFVTEPRNGLTTLLVPIHGRRGHDLGMVGLTLARATHAPDGAALARAITADLETETEREAA
ncbi:MAG TPA: sugar ABC transporter ATP-binding protein [Acetobacteraceae bacterium]|nr:sugar ABC transporter ATP-binding protein [Acetobacteraceae bacterium]